MQNLENLDIFEILITQKLLKCPKDPFVRSAIKSNVGSMCYCKSCRGFDLSVLVGILSGVDSDHGTCFRRNGSVDSSSTLCPIERRLC